MCGCGQAPKGEKSRFIPGHDARYHAAQKAGRAPFPTTSGGVTDGTELQGAEIVALERRLKSVGGVGTEEGQAIIVRAGEQSAALRSLRVRRVEGGRAS
jgi:hypothetical protein